MHPGVFITFDVECSMGGAWGDESRRPVPPARAMMGEYGDHRLGVPLITDALDAAGLKATFFLDPFAEEQGHPGGTEPVAEHLLARGHDVQLHVHPGHWHYGLKRQGRPFDFTDAFDKCSPEERREMLGVGAERIERWTGSRPAAFRSGNMAMDEAALADLPAAGIRIDSSYTFPYADARCHFSGDEFNGSRWYGQVLEVALSGFRQPRLPGLHQSKPVDLVAISFAECREAVRRICGAGADAVLILHSFSLMKVRNVQYNGGRANRIVIGRFRRLCDWLAREADDLPTYTFGGLAQAIEEGRYEAREAPPPTLSGPRALVRKAVQAYNNLYWT